MKLSCHCGEVVLIVDKAPERLTSCNCSICRRYNTLWGYYSPERVEIQDEQQRLSHYVWGDKELAFYHCSQCGCVTHYETLPGQPDPRIGANFCLAETENISGITIRKFDGAKMSSTS